MASPEAAAAEPLTCEKVGEPMPDIAGIGILLGFSGQAFISMVLAIWVFFWTKLGRLDVNHDEGTVEHASERKRLELVSSILMVGNDIQMLTGTALIITAYSSANRIDLYHLHLIYDTVSFVGISNCAALICYKFIAAKNLQYDAEYRARPKPIHRITGISPRFRVTYFYAVFFFILTVILEVRLSQWTLTSDEPGRCYRTKGITALGATHPTADQIYVAVTAAWLLGVMFATIFGSSRLRKPLLILSALQFPLHLYFMIALRLANQEVLEGDESEDGWDFGQTTAILLLGVALNEVFRKAMEYYRLESDLKRYGPAFANAAARERADLEKERGMEAGPITAIVTHLIEVERERPRSHRSQEEGHEQCQPLTRPDTDEAGHEV